LITWISIRSSSHGSNSPLIIPGYLIFACWLFGEKLRAGGGHHRRLLLWADDAGFKNAD
jgi:hypothetical protein